jgi:hypothetical protein
MPGERRLTRNARSSKQRGCSAAAARPRAAMWAARRHSSTAAEETTPRFSFHMRDLLVLLLRWCLFGSSKICIFRRFFLMSEFTPPCFYHTKKSMFE